MANTLLEAMKTGQNALLQQNQTAQGAGAPSETQSLAQTLAVGQTGKAQPVQTGGAAKMSNLQEKLAKVQTNLGTQALAQETSQQQTAAEQDADVAKRESQIQDEALEQRRQDQQKSYTRQVQSTIDNYTQQNKTLNLQKDKAKMEQLGFQLRLSNNKYINDLKTEGVKSRLNTKIKRNEEIMKSVFADEQELMTNDLQFRQIMGAKGRDLTEQLSNMDLEFAMKMADANNAAANQRMLWTGIGGLATAGIAAGGQYMAGQEAQAAQTQATNNAYYQTGGDYGSMVSSKPNY